MPTFSQIPAQIRIRKAPAVVQLAPSEWHDEWPDKPSASVAVGLRCISELDTESIKAQAAKAARELYPEAEYDDADIADAFNGALMRLAVARATCKPDDAGAPFFEMPEDQIAEAWLPATVRKLWDRLERLTIETSCVVEPAADDQVAELCGLLATGGASKLTTAAELRLRKLLSFCLDELRRRDVESPPDAFDAEPLAPLLVSAVESRR